MDDHVTINVGGQRHHTFYSTLKKIPATRLARLTEKAANYDTVLCEYYYDRHPTVFVQVLNYYRTGKLHYPTNVCGRLFEEELEFWGLDSNQVEPCCWMTYTLHRDTQDTLRLIDKLDTEYDKPSDAEIAKRFGWEVHYENGTLAPWKVKKAKLWYLLTEPYSSNAAMAISFLSILFMLLSIVSLGLKTVQSCQVPHLLAINVSQFDLTPGPNETYLVEVEGLGRIYEVKIIEAVCLVFCFTELVAKALCCPNLRLFVTTPANVIDLISIGSFYSVLLPSGRYDTDVFDVVNFLSVLRVIRLGRLTQHSSGFMILLQTFKQSARVLSLLLFFLVFAVCVFGGLLYYAERLEYHPGNTFRSMDYGWWWAMVTLTTVGYGDVFPRSAFGRFLASFCMMTSILTVALPLPVIVSNFQMIYRHNKARQALPKEKRRIDPIDQVISKHQMRATAVLPSTV